MKFDLSQYSSLAEGFMNSFQENRDRVALIEVDREQETIRYSYAELHNEALRCAALLQNAGLNAGDHCAIVMSNQSKWIISGVGIYFSGGVVVPIDYKLNSKEQWTYLQHCQAKFIVTEWPILQKWLNDGTSLPNTVRIFVTDAPLDVEVAPAIRWESRATAFANIQKRGREELCAILYSSGTGGKIKGCMLTHGNYLSQVQNFAASAKMRKGERYLSVLPTHHGIDFIFGFLYPILLGATVVHQRTLRPQYLMSTLKEYKINITSFVPIILKEIQKKIQAGRESLSPFKRKVFDGLVALNRFLTPKPRFRLSKVILPQIQRAFGGELRLIMTGGSFVDPKLARYFFDLGLFVGIGYGLTEAGTTVSAPCWQQYHDDNVGKPLANTQVEIRNPDSQGVGEIWIKSPSVMKGYFNDPELTEQYLVDGWLRTDDLGSLSAGGYLKIVGRKKNIIVTPGGENIYPEDVEKVFELPELKEYCVFGTNYLWPQTSLLEEKLFIVVHPHEETLVEKVVQRLKIQNRHLADHKRVQGFIMWQKDFPRTGSLKVKRQVLAEEVASEKHPQDIQKLA